MLKIFANEFNKPHLDDNDFIIDVCSGVIPDSWTNQYEKICKYDM